MKQNPGLQSHVMHRSQSRLNKNSPIVGRVPVIWHFLRLRRLVILRCVFFFEFQCWHNTELVSKKQVPASFKCWKRGQSCDIAHLGALQTLRKLGEIKSLFFWNWVTELELERGILGTLNVERWSDQFRAIIPPCFRSPDNKGRVQWLRHFWPPKKKKFACGGLLDRENTVLGCFRTFIAYFSFHFLF